MTSKTFELKKLEPLYLTCPRRKFWAIHINIQTNQTVIKYGKLLHDGTEKSQATNTVTKSHNSISKTADPSSCVNFLGSAINYVEKAIIIKLNKDYKIENSVNRNHEVLLVDENSNGKRPLEPLQNLPEITNNFSNGYKQLHTEIQIHEIISSKSNSQAFPAQIFQNKNLASSLLRK